MLLNLSLLSYLKRHRILPNDLYAKICRYAYQFEVVGRWKCKNKNFRQPCSRTLRYISFFPVTAIEMADAGKTEYLLNVIQSQSRLFLVLFNPRNVEEFKDMFKVKRNVMLVDLINENPGNNLTIVIDNISKTSGTFLFSTINSHHFSWKLATNSS